MSDTGIRRLAMVAFPSSLSFALAGFLLKQDISSDDVFAIPYLTFTVLGFVVALREPRNPVGWVFLLAGSTPTVGFFTSAYAFRDLHAGLPGGRIAEWISSWAWFPGIGSFVTFGLLLFPNGRLPSRPWRSVGYLAALVIVVVTLGFAFEPGPIEPFDSTLPSHENPFGWTAGADVIRLVLTVGFPLLSLVALASAVSLISRYRHSATEQRQQIKWFAYSAAVLIVIVAFEDLFERVLGPRATEFVFLFALVLPSIGAGIGILKYRLYDIDVVINRTLVYVVVTALLALVYLGGVIVMQRALGDLVRDSDVAVAASTLAVAGLFRPVRARTQGFIDQRFYRRKYDARQTLESFSSRLREKVDLESLNKELTEVVGQTMQPVHLSLWIRTSEVTR